MDEKKTDEVLDLAREALRYEQERRVFGKETADRLYATRHAGEAAVGAVLFLAAFYEVGKSILTDPVRWWFLWTAGGSVIWHMATAGQPDSEKVGLGIAMTPGFACWLIFMYREVVKKWGSISFKPGKCPFSVGAALLMSPIMLMALLVIPIDIWRVLTAR